METTDEMSAVRRFADVAARAETHVSPHRAYGDERTGKRRVVHLADVVPQGDAGKDWVASVIGKTPDGLSLGTPQLTALSHIPQRFTTAISGPNQVTIHYRYGWWSGEKRPEFILTSTGARFKERSCGWRDVSVERRAVVSLTTSHVAKTREYDIDLHTEDALYSVIECVSKAEATWIGRVFKFLVGQAILRTRRELSRPEDPTASALEPK